MAENRSGIGSYRKATFRPGTCIWPKVMRLRLTLAFATLATAAVAAVGCGNSVGFKGKAIPPVAVIRGPGAGPAGTTIELDGRDSYDPNAVSPPGIYSWEWTLVSSPAGSNASISAGNDERFGELVTGSNMAGRYIVQLRVRDINDFTWSEPTRYELTVFPVTGITTLLTWTTAVNDVDQHLVNETDGGALFDTMNDCFFQNLRPDWTPMGILDGDPDLHHDEVNGYGPEIMELPTPTDGYQYHLYVHYFSDDGLGPTDATVQVFENGTQIAEFQHEQLTGNQVWDVAAFNWSGATKTVAITPVDAISTYP